METITQRAAAALRRLRAASEPATPLNPGGDPAHDLVRRIEHLEARPAPVTHDPDLAQLAAEARYHRQRYDLYRAKMYALRPSTQRRLRELHRASEKAETRLAAATKATRGPDSITRHPEPGSS